MLAGRSADALTARGAAGRGLAGNAGRPHQPPPAPTHLNPPVPFTYTLPGVAISVIFTPLFHCLDEFARGGRCAIAAHNAGWPARLALAARLSAARSRGALARLLAVALAWQASRPRPWPRLDGVSPPGLPAISAITTPCRCRESIFCPRCRPPSPPASAYPRGAPKRTRNLFRPRNLHFALWLRVLTRLFSFNVRYCSATFFLKWFDSFKCSKERRRDFNRRLVLAALSRRWRHGGREGAP